MLAGVCLDRGAPAAALYLLDRLAAYCPDPDVPAARLAYKRVVCHLMLGEPAEAEAALDALAIDADTAPDPTVARLVAGDWRPGASPRAGEESWAMAGGDLRRRGHMPAVSPELRENLPWRYAIPMDDPDWWERQYLPMRHVERGLPAVQAAVADGRVFVRGLRQVVALDVESLEPLWTAQPAAESSVPPQFRHTRMWRAPEAFFDGYSPRDRLLHDYAGAALAVVGDLVFSIERDGGRRLRPIRRRRGAHGPAVPGPVAAGRTPGRPGR